MNHLPTPQRDGASPQPSPQQGLVDPRTIHPEPEDVVNDPDASAEDDSGSKSDQATPPEGEQCPREEPGIVDPRNDQIGPDL